MVNSPFTHPTSRPETTTVIIGSGIIGLSTAYYLSDPTPTTRTTFSSMSYGATTTMSTTTTTWPRKGGAYIHLVEASPQLFASASGSAAGFLAKDWFSPDLAPLGELSFDLHRYLAERHDGANRWGYCRSVAVELEKRGGDDSHDAAGCLRTRATGPAQVPGTAGPDDERSQDQERRDGAPEWLIPQAGEDVKTISKGEATAQVDPQRLCQFLLEECIKRGVHLHHPARATAVSTDVRDELASVRIESLDDGPETDLPCTRLVITAGVWTPAVFRQLFPTATVDIPVTSLAGHSLVVRSPRWTAAHERDSCHAVFATDSNGFSPELFSRLGGDIYIAGLNSTDTPVPKRATDAAVDPAAVELLRTVSSRLLRAPDDEVDLEVVREGFCHRPVTPSGVPFLARIPDATLGHRCSTRIVGGGVFVGAGHGPWGISLALGSGKVLSHLIEGSPTSIDVKPFEI